MTIKEQVLLDLNTDKNFAEALHEVRRRLSNMNYKTRRWNIFATSDYY